MWRVSFMRKAVKALLLVVFVLGVVVNLSAGKVTIKMATGGVGSELEVTKEQAKIFMKANPNVNVKIVDIPDSTTDKLAFFLQLIQAKSPEVDVFQVDVTWVGELSDNLIDLNSYPGINNLSSHMFPSLVKNNTVGSKLVALPYFADVAFMYYRKDLLEKYKLTVPKTWMDLTKTAYLIQKKERKAGNIDFVGYVWQGLAYDGLFCDALEWIYSNNGGTVISPEGKITINNENAAEALKLARNWIGTISPEGVRSMKEEESRAVFQSGNAAFMRNWTYAYVLGQQKGSKIAGKIGVAVLPYGKMGRGTSTLGGWQLAVSKYSNHKKEAVEFVKFLASPEMQMLRAEKAGQIPTIESLYTDKLQKQKLEKVFPFFDILPDTLSNAVARPSSVVGKDYGKVSQIIVRSFYTILGDKQVNVGLALQQLHLDLSKLLMIEIAR
jgi:trehalose/maltose transport system substrate-binding protein